MLTIRPKPRAAMPSITARDQLDRRHHVLDDAGDDLLAVELAEAAPRRAAIVVDEDVRVGTGGEQLGLHFRRAHVADHRRHGDAEAVGDVGRGQVERGRVAAVEDEIDAVLGERDGAAATEPAARRADDCLPAGNSEIQDPPPLCCPDYPDRASGSRGEIGLRYTGDAARGE